MSALDREIKVLKGLCSCDGDDVSVKEAEDELIELRKIAKINTAREELIMTASTKNLVYTKLQKARVMLQEMNLKKSGKNKFVGYAYYELGDFLPAVNSIFYDLGLCSIVSFEKEKASLYIFDSDSPNSFIYFFSPMADAPMKGALPIQMLGAVETYQRRYLYMMALEIVEYDAIDASKPEVPSTNKKPISSFLVEKPTSKITPNAGAGENLSEEAKRRIADKAAILQDHWNCGEKGEALTIYESILSKEDTLYLWHLLPSNVRNPLKEFAKEVAAGLSD